MTRNLFRPGFFRCLLLVICLGGAIAAGCKTEKPSSKSAEKELQPLAELSPAQQKQKEKAIAAKDQLFQSLFAELTQSMAEKGPAESISVCKSRAPEIAAKVSKDTGVRIGRTSFKLRNTQNTSPDWAKSFVNNRVEQETMVALPDNQLGVLLPIRLNATCTLCHGQKEKLMPSVKTAILANYPDDQATGFAEGDVRGYFWIEVAGEKNQK